MQLRFRYLPFLLWPLGLSSAVHLNGLERPRSDSDDRFRLTSSTLQNNGTHILELATDSGFYSAAAPLGPAR